MFDIISFCSLVEKTISIFLKHPVSLSVPCTVFMWLIESSVPECFIVSKMSGQVVYLYT